MTAECPPRILASLASPVVRLTGTVDGHRDLRPGLDITGTATRHPKLARVEHAELRLV